MKNPKKLTRLQKMTLSKAGIEDPYNWSLKCETPSELCVVNRMTKEEKTIPKKGKKTYNPPAQA